MLKNDQISFDHFTTNNDIKINLDDFPICILSIDCSSYKSAKYYEKLLTD